MSRPFSTLRRGNSPRARLNLEALEARDVPTVILPAPGRVGPAVLIGTDGSDQFVLRSGPTMGFRQALQFSDDGGRTFHTAPSQAITGIVVYGRSGNDRLTIDHGLGFVARAEGLTISYRAGYGSAKEFDELVITGDPGAGVNETYTMIGSRGEGQLTSSNGYQSQTVKFSPLASIVDTMAAESMTIAATAGSDKIEIVDGSMAGEVTTTRVAVPPAGMENGPAPFSVEFANKSVLNVDGGDGDDAILINNPVGAAGLRAIGLFGGAGFDTTLHLRDPIGVFLWHDGIEANQEAK